MGSAIVHLGLSAPAFWAMTMHEYQSAVEAQEAANKRREQPA